jgi:hypothetical protein
MVRGINQLMFCLVRSTMVLIVYVTIVNPFTGIHKKIRDPDSFLQSAVTHKRQHYGARCNAAGKLFAVCAFEGSGGIYLYQK